MVRARATDSHPVVFIFSRHHRIIHQDGKHRTTENGVLYYIRGYRLFASRARSRFLSVNSLRLVFRFMRNESFQASTEQSHYSDESDPINERVDFSAFSWRSTI